MRVVARGKVYCVRVVRGVGTGYGTSIMGAAVAAVLHAIGRPLSEQLNRERLTNVEGTA